MMLVTSQFPASQLWFSSLVFFACKNSGMLSAWCPVLFPGFPTESKDMFSTKGTSTQGFALELRILSLLTGSVFSLPGVCGCCGALRPRYKRLVDNIFPEDPEVNEALLHVPKLHAAPCCGSPAAQVAGMRSNLPRNGSWEAGDALTPYHRAWRVGFSLKARL